MIAVVGDLEIPGGSTIDKSSVVQGKAEVGADCRIRRNLKALGGISMAEGCLVRPNIASGGCIDLGRKTRIEGDVHAKIMRLSEGAEIHGRAEARQIQSVHTFSFDRYKEKE